MGAGTSAGCGTDTGQQVSFGLDRERQVKFLLEADHLVVRSAGSFGLCDLVALPYCAATDHARPRLIEVKATQTPYGHFPPHKRKELREAAEKVGGDAELAWWPKGGELRYIGAKKWPEERKA